MQIATNIRRITAGNGGPMTFTGTQSYIVGQGAVALIDPGPDLSAHHTAILAALAPDEVITHVLITHSHIDHTPLARAFNAPVYAYGDAYAGRSSVMTDLAHQRADLGGGEGVDAQFVPDVILDDGDILHGETWSLRAIHTPGHMANHLCFAWDAQHALFSGDHIMDWSTTLVSPPDGDLTAFMASLRKLQGQMQGYRSFPGHGEPVLNTSDRIEALLNHRLRREAQVLAALGAPISISDLTALIYTDINRMLLPVAARNVFAHLIDLHGRGLVTAQPSLSFKALFTRDQSGS